MINTIIDSKDTKSKLEEVKTKTKLTPDHGTKRIGTESFIENLINHHFSLRINDYIYPLKVDVDDGITGMSYVYYSNQTEGRKRNNNFTSITVLDEELNSLPLIKPTDLVDYSWYITYGVHFCTPILVKESRNNDFLKLSPDSSCVNPFFNAHHSIVMYSPMNDKGANGKSDGDNKVYRINKIIVNHQKQLLKSLILPLLGENTIDPLFKAKWNGRIKFLLNESSTPSPLTRSSSTPSIPSSTSSTTSLIPSSSTTPLTRSSSTPSLIPSSSTPSTTSLTRSSSTPSSNFSPVIKNNTLLLDESKNNDKSKLEISAKENNIKEYDLGSIPLQPPYNAPKTEDYHDDVVKFYIQPPIQPGDVSSRLSLSHFLSTDEKATNPFDFECKLKDWDKYDICVTLEDRTRNEVKDEISMGIRDRYLEIVRMPMKTILLGSAPLKDNLDKKFIDWAKEDASCSILDFNDSEEFVVAADVMDGKKDLKDVRDIKDLKDTKSSDVKDLKDLKDNKEEIRFLFGLKLNNEAMHQFNSVLMPCTDQMKELLTNRANYNLTLIAVEVNISPNKLRSIF